MILDELDAAASGLLRLLEDLRRARGLTVVVVSHDFAGMEALPVPLPSARRCAGIGGGVGGGNVMTTTSAPAHNGTRRPSRPIVLLIPVLGSSVIRPVDRRKYWWFSAFRCCDVLPGMGDDRDDGSFGAGRGPNRAHSRQRAAVGTSLAVDRLAIGFLTAALAGGTPVVAVGGCSSRIGRAHCTSCGSPRCRFIAPGAGGDGVPGPPMLPNQPTVTAWSAVSGVADPGRRMGGGARAARFPMLIDEFQVLTPRHAAERMRRTAPAACAQLIDLLAAAITVTLRRADEMGDAITARGGTGQLSAHPGH